MEHEEDRCAPSRSEVFACRGCPPAAPTSATSRERAEQLVTVGGGVARSGRSEAGRRPLRRRATADARRPTPRYASVDRSLPTMPSAAAITTPAPAAPTSRRDRCRSRRPARFRTGRGAAVRRRRSRHRASATRLTIAAQDRAKSHTAERDVPARDPHQRPRRGAPCGAPGTGSPRGRSRTRWRFRSAPGELDRPRRRTRSRKTTAIRYMKSGSRPRALLSPGPSTKTGKVSPCEMR